MGRGRKPKEVLDIEEQLDEALAKYITYEPLSLEETALLIWQSEGRKTEKPFTKMYMHNIEAQALLKLKKGLAKFGITGVDDMFEVNRETQEFYEEN